MRGKLICPKCKEIMTKAIITCKETGNSHCPKCYDPTNDDSMLWDLKQYNEE